MDNKIKILQAMVGFHKDDLSITRQWELETLIQRLNKATEWMLIALSKKSLEEWEQWGFGLIEKPDFIAEVDAVYDKYLRIRDEDVRREMAKIDKKKGPQVYARYDTLKRLYETISEKEWMLNTSLTEIGKAKIKALLPQIKSLEELLDLPEEDQLVLTAGIIRVKS